MSPEILASVVDQAAELGVSIIVIAGGEPLVRQEEIFTLAKAHPRILFPVFTNGLLIDETMADADCGMPEHRAGHQFRRIPGGYRPAAGQRGL